MSLHFSGPQLPLQADRLWGRPSEHCTVLPQGTLTEYACSFHERPASHVRSSRYVTQLCRALSSWTGAHFGFKVLLRNNFKGQEGVEFFFFFSLLMLESKPPTWWKPFSLKSWLLLVFVNFWPRKTFTVQVGYWMSFFLLWWWHESMLNASASTLCCLPPVAENIPATH